jgi:hypothetical protein
LAGGVSQGMVGCVLGGEGRRRCQGGAWGAGDRVCQSHQRRAERGSLTRPADRRYPSWGLGGPDLLVGTPQRRRTGAGRGTVCLMNTAIAGWVSWPC